MSVVHDERDAETEAMVMREMADMFRYSGDNGIWWAIQDEGDGPNTWRVHQDGAVVAHRTGLSMDAALEQAFTLSWHPKHELA